VPEWVEIEEIVNSRLEECLYGNISASEALSLMQSEVDAIIRE
jgi:hypothetical protein